MKYEDYARFFSVERVSDGIGGFEETEVEVSNAQCHLVALSLDIALEEYGYNSKKMYKAFCIEKPEIPDDNAIVKILNDSFKLIQVLPLKRHILLLEKVN